MSEKNLISVVSPVYKAENIVEELAKRITEEVKKITDDFEIILVEDGGPDNSWAKIEQICQTNTKVKGIKFSKNFGQHYAITAGLEASTGQYVIVMDCDLQDDPKYIETLYQKALEGFDIVYTLKIERKHSSFKNFTASIFYFIFNSLTNDKAHTALSLVGTYSLINRRVVDAFKGIKDYHRHYLMVLRMLGFKSGYVEVIHQDRFAGKSSYNFLRLLSHAIDGITSQTDKLLRLSISAGFIIFGISILWAIGLIISYFLHGVPAGYTSLMVLLLFSTGMILMSIGIMGLYISKIFDQVKGRPLYLIDKKINM